MCWLQRVIILNCRLLSRSATSLDKEWRSQFLEEVRLIFFCERGFWGALLVSGSEYPCQLLSFFLENMCKLYHYLSVSASLTGNKTWHDRNAVNIFNKKKKTSNKGKARSSSKKFVREHRWRRYCKKILKTRGDCPTTDRNALRCSFKVKERIGS